MTQIDASAPPRKVQLEDIPVKQCAPLKVSIFCFKQPQHDGIWTTKLAKAMQSI